MKRGFLWNFAGVVLYNLGQWLVLVGIAQALSAEAVGHYALALAIAAPVYLTLGLNLRLARATDAEDHWPWAAYTRLRFGLNIASFIVTVALGALFQLGNQGLAIIALVALSKGFEASSQLVYGQFQHAERMDLVARSLILRAVIGVGVLLILLGLTRSLPVAVAGQTVAWATVYLVHDRSLAHRATALPHPDRSVGRRDVWSLTRSAAPLGFDAGVGSFAISAPRFVVQALLGPAALGVFAALAYLAQLVSLTTGALGDAVIARLAKLHVSRDRRNFWRTMGLVLAFGWLVTGGALAAAALIGAPAIRFALGPEYVNQPVLFVLLLGAGFTTFQRTLARGLYASRRYSAAASVNFCVLVASVGIAVATIPQWGLVGAAATQGSAFAIGTLITTWFLLGRGEPKGAGS